MKCEGRGLNIVNGEWTVGRRVEDSVSGGRVVFVGFGLKQKGSPAHTQLGDEWTKGWTGGRVDMKEGGLKRELCGRCTKLRIAQKCWLGKKLWTGQSVQLSNFFSFKISPSLDWIGEGRDHWLHLLAPKVQITFGSSITIGPKVPKTVPLKTPRPVNGVLDEEDEEEREEEGEDEEEVN
jgi:hypothetical protein